MKKREDRVRLVLEMTPDQREFIKEASSLVLGKDRAMKGFIMGPIIKSCEKVLGKRFETWLKTRRNREKLKRKYF